jgi:hypothetical protein
MTVNTFEQTGFLQFLAVIDTDLASRAWMQGCRFCGGALHSACYSRKPRGGAVVATEATTRHSFCCDKCRRRTTPESVRFLGRRVYPGFVMVMVLLSAMQSGVTDTLINELQLHLGVARRTLQRWRHWWREIFVGTSFWDLGRGRFMPPIEHAALPMSLLDRFKGQDTQTQLVRCLQFLAPLSKPGFFTQDDGR